MEKKLEKKAVILLKPSGTVTISGELTEIQRKFYDVFLYNAREQLKENTNTSWFIVKLTDLKKFLNRENFSRDNKYLKKQIRRLKHITVEYNVLGKDTIIEGYTSLLTEVEFINDILDNSIIIKYNLPNRVKEAILKINNNDSSSLFAKIDLMVKKNLIGTYTLILYDLIKDYENVEIPKMTIEQFRKLFGIENKYKFFTDLRKRVLDPTIERINSNPKIDWRISYKLFKNGNKYTHIKFIKIKKENNLEKDNIINIKNDEKIEEENNNIKEVKENNINEIFELLKLIDSEHIGQCSKILKEAIKEYSKEYIKAQIDVINRNDKVKNYAGLLKYALEEDLAGWKEEEEYKKIKKQKEKIKEENKEKEREKVNNSIFANMIKRIRNKKIKIKDRDVIVKIGKSGLPERVEGNEKVTPKVLVEAFQTGNLEILE